MKKRKITAIAAILLVMTQAVVFPLAASADTWVDDSTYAGGGYWMDDEGYMVENGGQAPAPAAPLITGDDEPVYEDLQPQYEEPSYDRQSFGASVQTGNPATSGSIADIVSADPNAVQFTVTANGDVGFEFYKEGQPAQPEYSYESGLLTIFDSSASYMVVLLSTGGSTLGTAMSRRQHSYAVSYDLGGSSVTVESGTLSIGDQSTFEAPLRYEANGLEYELVGGETNQTQVVRYGKASYSFRYSLFQPVDRIASVELVDERGGRLEYTEQAVSYKGGSVVFDLPATIAKENRTFVKVDNTSKVTVDYFSSVLSYTFVYKEKLPVNTQPYSVKANYLDAETGVVIGGDFYTVTAQNIADNTELAFTLPQEIAYYTGDSTVYYRPENGASIKHQAADNKTLEYNVNYIKEAVDAPYTWSVRLVDTATGNILTTKDFAVTVASGASYEAEPQITVNGTKYLLDSGMQSRFAHNYGDSGRIQYVYYNAEGAAALSSYNITVRSVEIGGNTELRSETVAVSAEAGKVTVPVDESFTGSNGTSYVRLLGQTDIDHAFYSPQRSYTVYYRDADDVQNADTTVVREEIITIETVITNEVEEPAPAPTAPPANIPENTALPAGEEIPDEPAPQAVNGVGSTGQNTVISGDGETTVVNGEGVPLEQKAEEEIEENQAPKSAGDDLNNPKDYVDFSWIWFAVAAVLTAGVAVLVIIFFKKHKQNPNE